MDKKVCDAIGLDRRFVRCLRGEHYRYWAGRMPRIDGGLKAEAEQERCC